MFKWTVYYVLKWIKFSVKNRNIKKILEKLGGGGILEKSRKVGTMQMLFVIFK